MTEPKYIEFRWAGYSKSGVTETWRVHPKDGGDSLGWIKWFGAWRCYGFFPHCVVGEEIVFEKQCLRDIADFCEKVTKMQREKKLGHAAHPECFSGKELKQDV